nr:hypothetical protein Iba_scaffold17185CG0010 [Ipomoea batatas]
MASINAAYIYPLQPQTSASGTYYVLNSFERHESLTFTNVMFLFLFFFPFLYSNLSRRSLLISLDRCFDSSNMVVLILKIDLGLHQQKNLFVGSLVGSSS